MLKKWKDYDKILYINGVMRELSQANFVGKLFSTHMPLKDFISGIRSKKIPENIQKLLKVDADTYFGIDTVRDSSEGIQRNDDTNLQGKSLHLKNTLEGLNKTEIILFYNTDNKRLTIIDGGQRVRSLTSNFVITGLEDYEVCSKEIKWSILNGLESSYVVEQFLNNLQIFFSIYAGDSKYQSRLFIEINTNRTDMSKQDVNNAKYPGAIRDLTLDYIKNDVNDNFMKTALTYVNHQGMKKSSDMNIIQKSLAIILQKELEKTNQEYVKLYSFANTDVQNIVDMILQNQEALDISIIREKVSLVMYWVAAFCSSRTIFLGLNKPKKISAAYFYVTTKLVTDLVDNKVITGYTDNTLLINAMNEAMQMEILYIEAFKSGQLVSNHPEITEINSDYAKCRLDNASNKFWKISRCANRITSYLKEIIIEDKQKNDKLRKKLK